MDNKELTVEQYLLTALISFLNKEQMQELIERVIYVTEEGEDAKSRSSMETVALQNKIIRDALRLQKGVYEKSPDTSRRAQRYLSDFLKS